MYYFTKRRKKIFPIFINQPKVIESKAIISIDLLETVAYKLQFSLFSAVEKLI